MPPNPQDQDSDLPNMAGTISSPGGMVRNVNASQTSVVGRRGMAALGSEGGLPTSRARIPVEPLVRPVRLASPGGPDLTDGRCSMKEIPYRFNVVRLTGGKGANICRRLYPGDPSRSSDDTFTNTLLCPVSRPRL